MAEQTTLWARGARDWADVMEGWAGWGVPVYRHVLERVPVSAATAALDVGCGAGRFCRMVADRGAAVSGLDATPALLEIARRRVPEGDFRAGDMQELPWPDASFDVVTGFNSFFIAADMTAALAEARRVLRPGGRLAMTVFGRPEVRYSTTVFAAVASLLPGAPAGGGSLHEEGVLESVAEAAGLAVQEAGYLSFDERYPDRETLIRGLMAAPPMIRAADAAGAEAVRRALGGAIDEVADGGGPLALREEVRYLIARA
jgi:SAM-dependent methyltransferase